MNLRILKSITTTAHKLTKAKGKWVNAQKNNEYTIAGADKFNQQFIAHTHKYNIIM